ncbi:hypothetical protein ACHAPT_008072 [Fusarium lateritium]
MANICSDAAILLLDNNEEPVREEASSIVAAWTAFNPKAKEAKARLRKLDTDQRDNEREERLKEAQEKLSKDQQDLNEREQALDQSRQRLDKGKDQILVDIEGWERAKSDCIKSWGVLMRDFKKIEEKQAKTIRDQAKIINDQERLREDEQCFFEARKKVELDHTNNLLAIQRQANERLCHELAQKEERLKEEQRQTIKDEEEEPNAQYERYIADRIAQEKAELEVKHEESEKQLQIEYAQRTKKLSQKEEDTEAMQKTLEKSIAAMKLIEDSLDTLAAQHLEQSEIIETLLDRQSQEGDLISALHHAHDTAANYFCQLESVTQTLETERREHQETLTIVESASDAVARELSEQQTRKSQLMELVTRLEDEKATFKGRLETMEEQFQQRVAALEEEKKQHENDKKRPEALGPSQPEGRKRRHKRASTEKNPTFWYWTMKKAAEALDSFSVARSCSMKANELVPRLWNVLEDDAFYSRLLDFYNNAQPFSWRCLTTFGTQESFVAEPLAELFCPHHLSGQQCLQVRIVEENGNRAMDFRMA